MVRAPPGTLIDLKKITKMLTSIGGYRIGEAELGTWG